MRAVIRGDCSVLADIVGPTMNSSTITSTPGTCSRTFGPMPVDAAASGFQSPRRLRWGAFLVHGDPVRAASQATDAVPLPQHGLPSIYRYVQLAADRRGSQPARPLAPGPRPFVAMHRDPEPRLERS